MTGRIVISTNASLDGVVQDPDGLESFERGGWFTRTIGDDRAEWAKFATQEAHDAAALLLGRRSDQWFAERWSQRTGEWADRLNTIPKYVVSSTSAVPAWKNATILGGVGAIAALKEATGGDIVVYGSHLLCRALLERALVDEIRLVTFPVIVGAGRRLFAETSRGARWRLASNRRLGTNLAFSNYHPA